jgi:hypothetical protein
MNAKIGLFLVLSATISCSSLDAGEFDWMVREISRESGAKPIHIPFFGLARFAVGVAHPAGTSDLHLAVFENVDLAPERFSIVIDSVAGDLWKPMVRVRERRGESTNIYLQESGKDLRLLIGNFDGGDATLIQVKLRPEQLMKFVDEHRNGDH